MLELQIFLIHPHREETALHILETTGNRLLVRIIALETAPIRVIHHPSCRRRLVFAETVGVAAVTRNQSYCQASKDSSQSGCF